MQRLHKQDWAGHFLAKTAGTWLPFEDRLVSISEPDLLDASVQVRLSLYLGDAPLLASDIEDVDLLRFR